jgi:flagellar hook-length control protein FliK
LLDLPVPSAFTAPAATARPVTHSPPRNSSANAHADPFQTILAQELGQTPDGQALPGLGVPATAAKAAAAADASVKPGDDTRQTDAANDVSLLPACAGAIPLSPALADASLSRPVATGRAPLSLDARPDPLAQASVAAMAESQLPMARAAANFVAPGSFSPASAGEIAPTSSAQQTELQLPIAPAAADIAASATGEIRREVAFAATPMDQHRTEPPASAGINIGSVPPDQITQAPAAALEARVGARGWDQGLGDKLVWMAGHGQQVAELHLNPPDLGPLKITLTLNNDQASAQFVSEHALVRDAIETAMPRLREMLADSGITLGDTSVSADAFHEQTQPRHEPRAYAAPSGGAIADPDVVARATQLLTQSRGLVDTFA